MEKLSLRVVIVSLVLLGIYPQPFLRAANQRVLPFSIEVSRKTNQKKAQAKAPVPLAAAVANPSLNEEPALAMLSSFQAFTGKVIRNKVRLRTQPSLDAPIVAELNQGDLFLIIGQVDNFYVIKPSKEIKAYVFRSYVLDNVVEASRVNIRLQPELDAPIIGQLNAGDRVEGVVCCTNNKWLEITPAASVSFYIAKEYIEKAGDAHFLATKEKRSAEVFHFLEMADQKSQEELKKPFEEIQLEAITTILDKVEANYSDFPEEVVQAKELHRQIQETYIEKKIRHLELKNRVATETWQSKNLQLASAIKVQEGQLKEMEEKLQQADTAAKNVAIVPISFTPMLNSVPALQSDTVTPKMAEWHSAEEALYQTWLVNYPNHSVESFYQQQQQEGLLLRGLVEPYLRPVKNRPGDYLLINPANHLPVAFLYSTRIDLQKALGQVRTMTVVSRPNHNFAFPAYFVLDLESVQLIEKTLAQ